MEKSMVCEFCGKKFNKQFNFKRHLKTHSKPLDEAVSRLRFDSMSEFLQWKSTMEEETQSQYFQRTFVIRPGNKKYYYYYCCRSGRYQTKGQGKRRLKSQMSSKIGGQCPSRITLVTTDSSMTATFHKQHDGHGKDLEHLRLTKSFRASVAEKLKEGVSMRRIIDEIKNTAVSEQRLSRTFLLKRKDLHNIRREFNIQDHQLAEDSVSVTCTSEDDLRCQDERKQVKRSSNLNKAHELLEIYESNSFTQEDEDTIGKKLSALIKYCSKKKLNSKNINDQNDINMNRNDYFSSKENVEGRPTCEETTEIRDDLVAESEPVITELTEFDLPYICEIVL